LIILGKVRSTHKLGLRLIVEVGDVPDMEIRLTQGDNVFFGENETVYKVSGFKWWLEEQTVDLLLDTLIEPLEKNTLVFVASGSN